MKLKKKNQKDLSFVLGLGGTAKGIGQACGIGVVSLQNMKNRGPIGSPVKGNNTIPGTTYIYFASDAAAGALVTELSKMRFDMVRAKEHANKKSIGIKIDAPDNKPSSDSNVRRKIPRARAKR